MMPDFRYRQTTVTLDVRGHVFRAAGRQPTEFGWRAGFPDWQPAEEKGEEAQPLPVLRHGETAWLRDATVEGKETRPPPRYNEDTLIEAMQNAWRFVADAAQRERLKEAKGIGTPATRAEIIRGVKTQAFLVAEGKHIVPTERGLALFAVLERADPALVDPGVAARMERLLDGVLVGQQEMAGAIDAVCAHASRIIGRLRESAASVDARLLGGVVREAGPDRPPTPAMQGYVASLARRKGLEPPRGCASSGAACRAFLDRHAPKKDGAPAPADVGGGRPTPARRTMSNRRPPNQRAAGAPAVEVLAEPGDGRGKLGPTAVVRKRKASTGKPRPTRPGKAVPELRSPDAAIDGTPLRIPFGNKEAALQLGARYRAGGWYAPPSVDLAGFRGRGWL